MKIGKEDELLADVRTSLPEAKNVLVFAPHPDDEVFACGGILSLLNAKGAQINIHIATDGALGGEGDSAALVITRKQESSAATMLLGLPQPQFWDLPDRGLHYGENLVARVIESVESTSADLVFLPAPAELHPDHQALALAGIEGLRRIKGDRQVAFYEINTPLTEPNLLIDITEVAELKNQAMGCFKSQLSCFPYDDRVRGLNRFRAFSFAAEVLCVEAFFLKPVSALGTDLDQLFASSAISRRRRGYATCPEDLPLVSVIIRSMKRSTLHEALNSLAIQTYSNVEIVLVNAKGGTHDLSEASDDACVISMVNQAGEALGRSRAANLGLKACKGQYICFLDDDDTFEPDHLQKLVDAAHASGEPRAAFYSAVQGIRRQDPGKQILAIFAEPEVDFFRLLLGNILPIHAVLFPRDLLDEDVHFDETLDLFEDWDFWLQIARLTRFVFVPGVSANYYIGGGSGVSPLEIDEQKREVAHRLLLNKWIDKLSVSDLVGISDLYHNKMSRCSNDIDHMGRVLEDKECQLQDKDQLLQDKDQLLQDKDQLLQDKDQLLQDKDQKLRVSQAGVQALEDELQALYASNSWRVTSPLRKLTRKIRSLAGLSKELFYSPLTLAVRLFPTLRFACKRWGRRIYRKLPLRWRDQLVILAFRVAGPLFAGGARYELWRQGQYDKSGLIHATSEMSGSADVDLIDVDQVQLVALDAAARVAVHTHMYYPDLAEELAGYLRNMPCRYDLFVSVTDRKGEEICRRVFASLPEMGRSVIKIVPNRGRDIAPFFCEFGDQLRQYDYVAHIHSKKSHYNDGATDGWREYLLDGLFGSSEQLKRIFSLLNNQDQIGIVYQQNFRKLPYMAYTWLANRALATSLAPRFGLNCLPSGYFDYPAGTMFWARTEALLPLFDARLKLEDFPQEQGQTDGTMAHCLERFLVLIVHNCGFRSAILKDTQRPNWSRWRFEQFFSRQPDGFEGLVADPKIKLVVFDIFDTLLVRNLLDPEDVKSLVARKAQGDAGSAYEKWRVEAELCARQRKNRDVDMGEIFSVLQELSRLPSPMVQELRQLEESMEIAATSPRTEAVQLLQAAKMAGKRVVLASDMYLEKYFVERLLSGCDISGWDEFYISSDSGLRKDSGELYKHILRQEKVTVDAVLMVGDNERSDFQIPLDMGMQVFHLLRPVELAKSMPYFGSLVEKTLGSNDQNSRLTLGLIVRDKFTPIFYPKFDPNVFLASDPEGLGYSVLGPMVLSFVQWLERQARADGMERLYFLSREGQFLKQVYDRWLNVLGTGAQSEYLIVSRRAVTVPLIKSMEDVVRISDALYFLNSIENFLESRFGLTLSTEEWQELYRQGVWKEGHSLEISPGGNKQLYPLLQAILDRLIGKAESERRTTVAYLEKMGLMEDVACAVVDVGYSATIQRCLNDLLDRPVHGYYMATLEAAAEVMSQYSVLANGCFGHLLKRGTDSNPLLYQSFWMEKLLSSDEAQVCSYRQNASGGIEPEFRSLSEDELNTRQLRAEIQAGALKFVDDALQVRKNMCAEFQVPTDFSLSLYGGFVNSSAEIEKNILAELVLDDHYCGRDLVS